MALPPCHTLFQFYVQDNKLSCQLYQRSADVFLGVPFNIASYALLTHQIAEECGLGVCECVHTFVDVHLYSNHVEQMNLQVSRTVNSLPYFNIKTNKSSIFEYEVDDFEIGDYQPHPSINATVAV